MKQFFGKYRGKVVNNIDPMQLGRLQVSVPVVLGDAVLSWAMPCVPFAGPLVGCVTLPPIGANIWVEFEGGNPDKPIWTGCFWGVGEVPIEALPNVHVFKTPAVTVTVDPLGVKVVHGTATFELSATGITIANGAAEITLLPPTVSINKGALEVT